MQRQRGRSRPRAVVRFLVVLGFVLWIAHSLLVLHHKKQRTLVDRLVDRVHQDSDAGLKGAVPRTSALPSDEGGFDVDFDDSRHDEEHLGNEEEEVGSTSRSLEPPEPSSVQVRDAPPEEFTPVSRRNEANGGGVWMPRDWGTREQSKNAEKNAEADAECFPGDRDAGNGDRVVNPVDSLYSKGGSSCNELETIPGLCDVLSALLPSDGVERAVMLVFGGEKPQDTIALALAAVDETGAKAVLMVAGDDDAAAAAAKENVPYIQPDCDGPCGRPEFAVAAAVLGLGADVLLVGRGVELRGPNPLTNIPTPRGADVEGVTYREGMFGDVVGMSDPDMGWSAYSQSMAVPHIVSSLVLLRATEESIRLAAWLAERRDDVDADVALTDELLMPAHDARQRSGATFRLLPPKCFRHHKSGAAVVEAAEGLAVKSWHGDEKSLFSFGNKAEDPNKILSSETFDAARSVVLRDGPIGDGDKSGNCAAVDLHDRVGPKPRALRYIAATDGEFPVNCDGDLSQLCKVVSRVAVKRQVLAAVSNSNILYMLGLFLDGVAAANITNTIVVALDQKTADWCKDRGAPYYYRELKSLTGATDNHATSGLKFRVLHEFLSVGVSALLSDVDVVWMRNPFGGSRLVVPAIESDPDRVHVDAPAIYGDSDVEGMTDGWDDVSAYGFEYPGVGGTPMRRLAARNSGLFYLAATKESLRMVARLAERMATERNTWDQTAYNEEQVWMWTSEAPTAGNRRSVPAGVSQRVMNYACFQNTKYLFRYMRYDPELYDGASGRSLRPISAHVNYHPEKPQRMVTLIEQYLKGERDAISKWNWGEGMAFAKPCLARPKNSKEADALMEESDLARQILERISVSGDSGTWAGIQGFAPREKGALATPWGDGKWGVIPPKEVDGGDRLFVDFSGAKHMVHGNQDRNKGSSEKLHLTSTRCTDGEKVDIVI